MSLRSTTYGHNRPTTMTSFCKLLVDKQVYEVDNVPTQKIHKLFEDDRIKESMRELAQTLSHNSNMPLGQNKLMNQKTVEEHRLSGDLAPAMSSLNEFTNQSIERMMAELDVDIAARQNRKKRLMDETEQVDKMKKLLLKKQQRYHSLIIGMKHRMQELRILLHEANHETLKMMEKLVKSFEDLALSTQNFDGWDYLFTHLDVLGSSESPGECTKYFETFNRNHVLKFVDSFKNDACQGDNDGTERFSPDSRVFDAVRKVKDLSAVTTRAKQWYSDCTKIFMESQAKEESTKAIHLFYWKQFQRLEESHACTVAMLRQALKRAESQKNELKLCINTLNHEKVQMLMSLQEPLLKKHLLLGDYCQKLALRKYVIEKQDKAILLLCKRQTAFSILPILFAAEEAGRGKIGQQIGNLLEYLGNIKLTSALENKWLHSVREERILKNRIQLSGDDVTVAMSRLLSEICARSSESHFPFTNFDDIVFFTDKLQESLDTRRGLSCLNENLLKNLHADIRKSWSVVSASRSDGEETDTSEVDAVLKLDAVQSTINGHRSQLDTLSHLLLTNSDEVDRKKSLESSTRAQAHGKHSWISFF